VQTVEFISERYLAQAAWRPGLIVFSRPVQVERRVNVRRADDRQTMVRPLHVSN